MAAASTPQRIKGILSVTVLKAKNLIKSDWSTENDCYAVISLEPLTMAEKVKAKDKKQQTETYQKTQIYNGSNPIFNEKLAFPVSQKLEALYIQLWDADYDKDDLLAYGTLNLLDDDDGGRLDTNTDKEWLHMETMPMLNEKGDPGSTLEVILHFIPETVAAYMGKRFDVTQAEIKKKLTQQIVGKMTNVAAEQVQRYVGIGV
jgi:hypothetical protein